MTITFSGDTFESTARAVTNCFSQDKALADFQGNYGFPLRSLVEVYGPKGIGKTTWCLSMIAIIAKRLQKNTAMLDWEGQSKETVAGVLESQGFFGNVEYITMSQKDKTSEDTIERFMLSLKDEDQNVGLLDSIGGYIPTADFEGKISDANMGVFARETGRMVNKMKQIIIMAKTPGVVFMTNHEHPKIGSFVTGSDTSGGVRKKYLSHVRISLGRYFGNKQSPVSGYTAVDGGWLLKGKIDDNRYGYSKGEFVVWMMGGEGIHVGLTSMWDCIIGGIAKLSSKKAAASTTVSMAGKTYGKLGWIQEHRNDDPEFFVPFQNALRENEVDFEEDEESEEE